LFSGRASQGADLPLAVDIENINLRCGINEMEPGFQQYPQHLTAISTTPAPRRTHVDCSVNYTHELGDEAKEISGRFVVRAVPLLYGVLAGVLMGNLAAGLLVGGLVSLIADVKMGSHSLLRGLLGSRRAASQTSA